MTQRLRKGCPEPAAGARPIDITRAINAERVVLLGWGRAILLQLAHPLVAAGVYDHSSFRATPWAAASRLHATVRAMLALTFGTDAERERALYGIREIHRRVHGQLPTPVGCFAAGTPYSAEDPALVLWVHLTLLESIPMAYELFVAPLTDAERDGYCASSAWAAIALGAEPDAVPGTWADMKTAMATIHASGAIGVGPQAHELARAVLAPGIGRILPPAAWLNRLVTLGLLPPAIRQQYGFPWAPSRQRTLDRMVPIVRTARHGLPAALALWPEARD